MKGSEPPVILMVGLSSARMSKPTKSKVGLLLRALETPQDLIRSLDYGHSLGNRGGQYGTCTEGDGHA